MKLVHWPLMDGLLHLVQRGGAWAGWGPAQSPPRCTKCISPSINGQCTNFILFDVHYNSLCPLKGRCLRQVIPDLLWGATYASPSWFRMSVRQNCPTYFKRNASKLVIRWTVTTISKRKMELCDPLFPNFGPRPISGTDNARHFKFRRIAATTMNKR